jgi:hypothetical protein
MTAGSAGLQAAAPVEPTWAHVVPTLWVASTPLEYVGAVELVEGGFLARDRFGTALGVHSDVDTAKREVVHSASVGAGRPQ